MFGEFNRVDAGPIFSGSRISARQVEDGLSKTIAIAERHLPPVPENTPPEMEDYEIGDTASIAGDTPHTTFRCTEKGLATSIDDKDRNKFGSSHSERPGASGVPRRPREGHSAGHRRWPCSKR